MSTAQKSDWTSGYVSEIDYTHGYYSELAPGRLALCMLSKSLALASRRPLRYLELGFGQGLSLNIHAAAVDGTFWGTDFNPGHAATAAELAQASGADLTVLDNSFAELAARDDLPEFDVIVLHGIWSWISDENRAVITDIARRKLAPGGIFYVSYNCTPGWSPAMPLRHLMALHVEMSGEAAGMVPRIDAALEFTRSLEEAGAAYFAQNPGVGRRLKSLAQHDRHYLAHEFFNADWHPMPFASVAEILETAKLGFATSANLFDHVDLLNLTAKQQAFMAGVSHPVLRETVRDYCTNQQFRRDIWVKGARNLPAPLRDAAMRNLRFTLTRAPEDISLKVTGLTGTAELRPDVYQPIIDALARDDFAPKTVGELNDLSAGSTVDKTVQALLVLSGAGHVHPVQDPATIGTVTQRCNALNSTLIAATEGGTGRTYLASPVLGAGLLVDGFEQHFLAAISEGAPDPAAWANRTWSILDGRNVRIVKDGKQLATADENLAELNRKVAEFATKRLPLLRALGIAPR